MSIDVRPAHRSDISALSIVLGRAFHQDPVTTWMLPDPAARRAKLHRVFAAMTRHHHLDGGGVELAERDGEIGAAALWDPPGRWQHRRREELLALPRLLLTFGRLVGRGAELSNLMKKAHPEEPHWYLAVIGSEPVLRGGGFGHALMQTRLDRVDAEHAPAYLESSKADNVPYYSRFGFEVTGEIALPDGGPTLWPMWRAPR
ncbi:GNAT family N-acetyltransferase [Mycolicibacterium komossense]|uniref:GNAT family N-acetyltransferase n=1 Tax=Mycolicibacterium komossense TaxID=1779 RepID=A0ABT3C7R6_9MYCO|nr:GNAT family N-acetyltransferase [Mycolicibacterium komossense]MCV7225512.1 GNAT family N-acetyltransferase [Mycolicibacterium komossense]